MKKIISCLLSLAVIFTLVACDEENKEEFAKEISVENLVKEFNANINVEINNASEDYLVVENGQYWYGLYDGLYLIIEPEKDTDIVNLSTLFLEKENVDIKLLDEYLKVLLKANCNGITDEQLLDVITKVKENVDNNDMLSVDDGIFFGCIESDKTYQCQVQRMYKIEE